MSRIFNTPTYLGTTECKIIRHRAIKNLKANPDDPDLVKEKRAIMASLGIDPLGLRDCYEIEKMGERMGTRFMRMMASKNMRNIVNLSEEYERTKICVPITELYNSSPNHYYDYDAISRVLMMCLNNSIVIKHDHEMVKEWSKSYKLASEITCMSMFASRSGTHAMGKFTKRLKNPSKWSKSLIQMVHTHSFIEGLRSTGNQMKYSTLIKDIENGIKVGYSDFRDDYATSKMLAIDGVVYGIGGMVVIKVDNACYWIDHTHQVSLMKCVTFWLNALMIREHGYLSGRDVRNNKRNECFDIIFSWMKSTNIDIIHIMPKHMKNCVAYLINNYGDTEYPEPLDTGSLGRSNALKEDVMSYPGNPLLPLLLKCGADESDMIDLLHLFHGIPAVDADPGLLMSTLCEKQENARKVDTKVAKDFMNYSKTLHVTLALHGRHGKDTKSSIKFLGESCPKWVRRAQVDKSYFPRHEEWGSAWIENMFKFKKHIEFWYLSVNDVSHVSACEENFRSLDAYQDIRPYEHNEISYALRHAPFLSHSTDPNHLRAQWCRGDVIFNVSTVAAKPENTKFKEKIREFYISCDTLREMNTEAESNAVNVSRLGEGCMLRASPVTTQKRMVTIANMLRDGTNLHVVVMSLDVSGWSTYANREFMLGFHDYVLKMCSVPPGYSLKKLWTEIMLYMIKMGDFIRHVAVDGLYQGWTGTLDTIFHYCLACYAVRICKEKGILRLHEKAQIMVLIDDGVIALSLDESRTAEDTSRTASLFYDVICSVYLSLGMEIDRTKTICSSTKYTFLNRLFHLGKEIFAPLKTVCKVDIQRESRFPTIRDHCSALFGSARSTLQKGADPLWSYFLATLLTIKLVRKRSLESRVANSDIWFPILFAPRCLGGMGLPTLIHWASSEIRDDVTHYIHASAVVSHVVGHGRGDEFLGRCLCLLDIGASAGQSPLADCRMPNTKLSSRAEDIYKRVLKLAVKRFQKSRLMEDIMNTGCDDRNTLLHEVLKNVIIDTSVLEELTSLVPESLSDTIINQMSSAKSISNYLKPLERVRLMGSIIRAEKLQFRVLFSTIRCCTTKQSSVEVMGLGGAKLASDFRSRCYSVHGLSLVNHTLSDPHFLICKANGDLSPSLIVRSYSCVGKRGEFDMIHGNTTYPPHRGLKTKGLFIPDKYFDRSENPVSSRMIKAAFLMEIIKHHNGDANSFWEFFRNAWCETTARYVPRVDLLSKTDMSLKHLGSSRSNTHHIIELYGNCSGAVSVSGEVLQEFLDDTKLHLDFMSVVNCLRVATLLEQGTSFYTLKDMDYDVNPSYMIPSDNRSFVVLDQEGFKEAISKYGKRLAIGPEGTMKRFIQEAFGTISISDKTDRRMTIDDIDAFLDYGNMDIDKVSNALMKGICESGENFSLVSEVELELFSDLDSRIVVTSQNMMDTEVSLAQSMGWTVDYEPRTSSDQNNLYFMLMRENLDSGLSHGTSAILSLIGCSNKILGNLKSEKDPRFNDLEDALPLKTLLSSVRSDYMSFERRGILSPEFVSKEQRSSISCVSPPEDSTYNYFIEFLVMLYKVGYPLYTNAREIMTKKPKIISYSLLRYSDLCEKLAQISQDDTHYKQEIILCSKILLKASNTLDGTVLKSAEMSSISKKWMLSKSSFVLPIFESVALSMVDIETDDWLDLSVLHLELFGRKGTSISSNKVLDVGWHIGLEFPQYSDEVVREKQDEDSRSARVFAEEPICHYVMKAVAQMDGCKNDSSVFTIFPAFFGAGSTTIASGVMGKRGCSNDAFTFSMTPDELKIFESSLHQRVYHLWLSWGEDVALSYLKTGKLECGDFDDMTPFNPDDLHVYMSRFVHRKKGTVDYFL